MNWRRALIPVLIACVLPSAAAGQERDCRDNHGVDRCAPAQQAQVRALFGVQPIEAHRDAGEEVYRVFFIDGYGEESHFISFVRPFRSVSDMLTRRAADPELWVRFPRRDGTPTPEPLHAVVSQEAWDLIVERARFFDRELVPLPEPVSDNGEMVTCMHGGIYSAEAVESSFLDDDQLAIRRRTENGCSQGLTEAFANELERSAVELLPDCGRLDGAHYIDTGSLLAQCARLGGDRAAAAAVRNAVNPMLWNQAPNDFGRYADLFHRDARIDWNGEVRTGQPGLLAPFWADKFTEAVAEAFFPDRIHGEGPGRVRLTGVIERSVPSDEDRATLLQAAPVEMIWVRSEGRFLILDASVGAFETYPGQQSSADEASATTRD
jgi:hypothetical protein